MKRKITSLLVGMALVCSVVPASVSAHLDPPGDRILVKVEWTEVGTDTNLNDGAMGTSDLNMDVEVVHAGHGVATSHVAATYEFGKRTNRRGLTDPRGGMLVFAAPVLVYSHEECSPMNPIRISIPRAWEEDVWPDADDELGSVAAGPVFMGPGSWTLITGGGPAANGHLWATFRVTVTAIGGPCPGGTINTPTPPRSATPNPVSTVITGGTRTPNPVVTTPPMVTQTPYPVPTNQP